MRFLFIICFALLVCSSGNAQSDTLNRIDANGKKTGYWIIYGKDMPRVKFADDVKVEEGRYDAGKKTGMWKAYYQDEMIKFEIEYKNNRPNGKFITYYVNGNIEEKGIWNGTRYVDTFYKYYPTGVPAQLKYFNTAGKTDGLVTYWFPTGEIEVQFNTKNGIETSDEIIRNKSANWKQKTISIENLCLCKLDTISDKTILVSRKSGDTVNMFYIDFQYFVRLEGKYSKGSLYEGNCEIEQNYGSSPRSTIIRRIEKGEILSYKDDNTLPFDGNGDHTIYNMNKQISEDGFFKDGILINGKKYIYDKNGLLDKIEIYKNGKYIGDGEIIYDKKVEEKSKLIQSDSLNRKDQDMRKTGYWFIYGKDKPGSGFAPNTIVEEGSYLKGKKTGLWKTYHRQDVLKSEIEYVNNRPNGKFITYYENGQMEDSGTWTGMKYVGAYKSYFENGCLYQQKYFKLDGISERYIYFFKSDTCGLKEISFNENGRKKYDTYNRKNVIIDSSKNYYNAEMQLRKQFQQHGYYYNTNPELFVDCQCYKDLPDSTEQTVYMNSQVFLNGEFRNKRLYTGKCYDYYQDTVLKRILIFEEGIFKYFEFIYSPCGSKIPDGYNKLYNQNKQIEADGELKCNALWTGKYYLYDKNGMLMRILIYKNGKYVGDAEID